MKNYIEFICAIILIVLATVCGYMSNEIWQYTGAALITFIGFIVLFMQCKSNEKIKSIKFIISNFILRYENSN